MSVVSAVVASAADASSLLAKGGVDPKEAAPGLGAFFAVLVIAIFIILLAWSFTRHQRKIKANAARVERHRQEELGLIDDGAPSAISPHSPHDDSPLSDDR